MSETTGEKIRRRREQLVLGRSEIARQAGLTHSSLTGTHDQTTGLEYLKRWQ